MTEKSKVGKQRREVIKGFVALEGLDGAGTSTQLGLLDRRAKREGVPLYATYEPTDGPIGREIRRVLRGEEQMQAETLAFLYAADRNEHLFDPENGILHRAPKQWVVSDRYLFSSLAYQSLDWPFEQVWALNEEFPLPEHLLFIDVPPEECGKRLDTRATEREIYEERDLQEEIRNTYYHIFSLYRNTGMSIHIFDGTLTKEKLADCIWSKLVSFR